MIITGKARFTGPSSLLSHLNMAEIISVDQPEHAEQIDRRWAICPPGDADLVAGDVFVFRTHSQDQLIYRTDAPPVVDFPLAAALLVGWRIIARYGDLRIARFLGDNVVVFVPGNDAAGMLVPIELLSALGTAWDEECLLIIIGGEDPDFEVVNILDLGTCHVPSQSPSWGNLDYAHSEHGWVVRVPATDAGTPEWTHPVLAAARKAKARFVNFDSDGPECDALPHWKW